MAKSKTYQEILDNAYRKIIKEGERRQLEFMSRTGMSANAAPASVIKASSGHLIRSFVEPYAEEVMARKGISKHTIGSVDPYQLENDIVKEYFKSPYSIKQQEAAARAMGVKGRGLEEYELDDFYQRLEDIGRQHKLELEEYEIKLRRRGLPEHEIKQRLYTLQSSQRDYVRYHFMGS